MEYREYRAEGIASDDSGKLAGLVTPFDRETTIGDLKRGGWRETVRSGFFKKTLDEGDALMVYQHDLSKPMARKSAGNLDLAEGERDGQRGLTVDADPVDTSYTRDCMALVRAKVINGMSFGFNVVKDAWYDDNGNPSDRFNGTRRELLEGQLIEVSPVTRPAYGGTSISARDESSALLEQRQRAAEAGEARAAKPYGNVKYADPKNGKYPIDTEEHIRAAWSYINMPKNAAKYPLNGVTLSEVKSKIRAAMKGIGADVDDDRSADEPQADPYEDEFYERAETEPTGGPDSRDDPDGHEYEAIDEALRQIKAGDVKGAEKTLAANQAARNTQEPEASTPDPEDDFALRLRARDLLERSRELGFD